MPKIPTPSSQGLIKNIPQEATKNSAPDPRFKFGFQHWSQQDLFGLKHEKVTTEWFVSLLEILRDLSSKAFEKALADGAFRSAMRFHPIEWGQYKSGITEAQFNSFIPARYHSEEYEVYQFQISISKGRVVGFFDEGRVFQIVLLDPAHNIQLGRWNDYKTNVTGELENCHQRIIGKLAHAKSKFKNCSTGDPKLIQELEKLLQDEGYNLGYFVFLDETYYADLEELINNGKYPSLDYLLIEALDLLLKKHR